MTSDPKLPPVPWSGGEIALSLFDYAKAAFKSPYNLILVAGGLLAGIVTLGTLGPAVFWPVTLAIELAYLAFRSHSERFQALVKAREIRLRNLQAADPADEILAGLSEERRSRFDLVRSRCMNLQQSMRRSTASSAVGGVLESQQIESVNKLLWVFLKTLAQEEMLDRFCKGMPRVEIEQTLSKTERALEDEGISESIRRAHEENREVLKRRLDNLQRAQEHLESLQTRLVRVENSILLIQEQALTRQDPSFIEAEVRSVTEGLSTMENLMSNMDLPTLELPTETAIPEFVRPTRGRVGTSS